MEQKNLNDQTFDEWSADDLTRTNNADYVELGAEEPTVQQEQLQQSQEEHTQVRKPVRKEKNGAKTALSYLHDVVYLLTGLVLVFLLLFRVVIVSGTSMNSTLLDGDYLLLLSNTFYRNPQPGDIIVASKQSFDNGAPIVKRVIAVEGQKVDIIDGIVYVDDVALDEPYALEHIKHEGNMKFPLVVEPGCLFVLGDNRNNSRDSRDQSIGLIDKREVLGKVIFLFFPGTNHDQQPKDFNRIGVVG